MGSVRRDQAPGGASSSGAPVTSRGSRKLLPVKRRMVAWSTNLSTVAIADDSEGKRFFHWEKPVFAVRMMDPWRWRALTRRKR